MNIKWGSWSNLGLKRVCQVFNSGKNIKIIALNDNNNDHADDTNDKVQKWLHDKTRAKMITYKYGDKVT